MLNHRGSDRQLIPMSHRYPFNHHPDPPSSSSVKLRRRFQPHQHRPLKHNIQRHSSLKDPSLIRIEEAFESQKRQYFDIIFEWVPFPFKRVATTLTSGELQQQKQRLLELCWRMITVGIHPVVTEDILGFTAEGNIKLYMDIDFSLMTGSSEQLFRAKEMEVDCLFRPLQLCVTPRCILRPSPHHPGISIHPVPTCTPPTQQRNTVYVNAQTPTRNQIKSYEQELQEGRKHLHELMRQPRPFKGARLKEVEPEDEQVSASDTYKEELGQMTTMPKITNADFRQTTNDFPHLLKVTTVQPRMSTGNSHTSTPLGCKQKEEQEPPIAKGRRKEDTKLESVENSYYYRKVFGFGLQRDDPLTREFTTLLEDECDIFANEQQCRSKQSGPLEFQDDAPIPLSIIKNKVAEAVRRSQQALDLVERLNLRGS